MASHDCWEGWECQLPWEVSIDRWLKVTSWDVNPGVSRMSFQYLPRRGDSLSMAGIVAGGQRSGHHPVGGVGRLRSSLVRVETESAILPVFRWSRCGLAHGFPTAS